MQIDVGGRYAVRTLGLCPAEIVAIDGQRVVFRVHGELRTARRADMVKPWAHAVHAFRESHTRVHGSR
jgi:hypothetical protein